MAVAAGLGGFLGGVEEEEGDEGSGDD